MVLERKGFALRRAQTDMRRLAQQYDVQAANTADPEEAAELRELAEGMRAQAEALKPLPTGAAPR